MSSGEIKVDDLNNSIFSVGIVLVYLDSCGIFATGLESHMETK